MFKKLSSHRNFERSHKYINIDDVIAACKEGFDSNILHGTGITDRDFENIVKQVSDLNENNTQKHILSRY